MTVVFFRRLPYMNNTGFSIFLEPIYNPVLQTYMRVLTVNRRPQGGPLQPLVRRVQRSRLSPFQDMNDISSCIHVLLRYSDHAASAFHAKENLMGVMDIPDVLMCLRSQGYTVDAPLTSFSQEGSRKLVATVYK